MFAKLILLLIICAAAFALFSGIKKIFAVLSFKGGCGCSKTGAAECHCHDSDKKDS